MILDNYNVTSWRSLMSVTDNSIHFSFHRIVQYFAVLRGSFSRDVAHFGLHESNWLTAAR